MAIGDEKVTIRIDVKADTAAIDRVRQKLRQLCREADECADTFDRYSASVDDAGEAHTNLDKRSSSTTQQLRRMGKEANGLARILKTAYKFAFIAAGIETAALALALSSVNGLLATGRFLVKSYHVAMSALAKAAAAAGVALATVAAAQRQFVAAQSTGRYGGNYALASRGLRTMTADANLASLGMKTLSGAFQAASRNARVTGATTGAMAGLMDFAVASGDIEKGAQAVATLVSLVQKGGAGQAGVLEAAKQLGPEFEKAFKEATRGGKATSAELMKLFSSGELARQAGLAGGFAATQGSLVGQLKAFMTEMQVMFGDLGMRFIEPMQTAFAEIRRIMVRTVTQLMPLLDQFARETMIDKIVNGIDKMSQFLVTLMQDYVPRSQGFFESMSRAWNKMTDGFERFNRYLNRFKEASKIINTFFGQIFGAIGSGLKNNFEAFAVMLVDNQVEFDKFGKSLANLITQIFNLFNAIREAFMRALPAITTLANVIAQIVSSIADLIRMLAGASIPGGLGGLAALMLPMYAGLGGVNSRRGRAGKKPIGAGGALGIGAGVLGVAGLGQIPGIGETMGGMASAGLLAAMFAPAKTIGAGRKTTSWLTNLPKTSKGLPLSAALGVAAAGAVGTNAFADWAYRQGGTAASVGAGVGGGAATGAAVGAMFGGLPGAAIGAIGGAIIGGIMGWAKDGKYKDQAKKASKQFVENYASGVETLLAGNDMAAATQAMGEFDAKMKEFAKTQVKAGTAEEAGMKAWEERSEGLQNSLDLMGSRFSDLEQITGMTTDQIRDMANAADIDLGSSLISLQQILEATGMATQRFGDDFNTALTNSFAGVISEIQQTVDILNAPNVANETARALREAALAGTLTPEQLGAGVQTLAQQELLMAGGDPIKAMEVLMQRFGVVPGGGAAFNVPGAIFSGEGVKEAFMGAGWADIQASLMGGSATAVAQLAAENLISGAAGIGKTLGVSTEQLTAILSELGTTDPMRLLEIAKQLREGPAFTEEGALPKGGRFNTVETQLKDILGEDLAALLKPDDTSEQKLLSGINDTVAGFRSVVNDNFAVAVQEFGTHVDKLAPGDTSTPRRNIVGTLGAHSRFDAMIAGNRTVTSGLRNWGLGSMSSDHAAGRAYDLVGQNLGLYQAAVKASGGYAEFHGGSSSRHLHVVPNTANHIGDDPTPVMRPVATASVGGNTITNNFVINQQPGENAESLAMQIMDYIDRSQKSRSERY